MEYASTNYELLFLMYIEPALFKETAQVIKTVLEMDTVSERVTRERLEALYNMLVGI